MSDPTTPNTIVLLLIATLGLVAGWLAGASERWEWKHRYQQAEFDDHVEQALRITNDRSMG